MKYLLPLLMIFVASISFAQDDFYTARELINEERYEKGMSILLKLDPTEKKETLFYLGLVYEKTLDNQTALNYYALFLKSDCDQERLRVGAWRRMQFLLAIKEGQMSDVHQRMDYSRRKLSLQDTGEETQREQQNILDMIEKMIKNEEKKEASSSSKQKKKQQQQEQQSQGQGKKEAMGKNDKGSRSNNANGQVRKEYTDGPQSPWSRLRDRSRDPANSAIKEKLPARYRNLVEKYYEKANEKDD